MLVAAQLFLQVFVFLEIGLVVLQKLFVLMIVLCMSRIV